MNSSTNLKRRDFLQTTLGFAAAAAAANPLRLLAQEKKKIQIAVQLYAVQTAFAQDVPGTLKRLGEMGFQAVEFWGYNGTPNVYRNYSAADLKKMLDDANLKCCGFHCSTTALEDANLSRTVENSQTLGNDLLNIAQTNVSSVDLIKKFADFLNQVTDKFKDKKMRAGYHAHGQDFRKIDGEMAYERLFKQVNKDVNMQIDIGHALEENVDPVPIFKQFPGRSTSIHFRETGKYTFETPAYKEIFDVLANVAATKWYIIEYERSGFRIEDPQQALVKLRGLGM